MGGVGFMSHSHGVQSAYVEEMDVVTGLGDIVSCNSESNADLFDSMRGGLGQCGVITSATIPLIHAPNQITILKVFYLAKKSQAFADDIKMLVDCGRVDMSK